MASSPFSTSSRLWSDKPPTNEIVPPPGTAKAGKAYPERLIIYHAGTGRITFLACLKLTTLFVFGFFGLIAVPSSITAGEPLYWTASLLACGIIPVVYVAYFTSPFVAHIHLHLPPFARWSRPILEKFVKTAPPNTKIDITTMSLIGKPRVSSMMLSDIKPAKSRLGLVNYARDTTLADKGRKWWRFKAVGEFSIQETHVDLKKIKTGWAWKELAEQIHKKAAGAVGQK
ncbi:hypothetical protein QBC35DRAFT_446436 [Podospora australis]|uniref:Uncharacterized protein n=1 Tax=Podospora australis TaxID=1536484 RepID=A0AAN6X3K7_9PEZI|nr:hypothetical protein QBC35DRAFT_446436 [Podospora australis]